MEQFLLSMCNRLSDFFFKSYGDYKDTEGKDVALPATADWQVLISINKPSILYIKNTDAANEIMFTWNKDNSIGAKVTAGVSLVLDGVSGIVYARTVDSTKTAIVNVLAIALKTNE